MWSTSARASSAWPVARPSCSICSYATSSVGAASSCRAVIPRPSSDDPRSPGSVANTTRSGSNPAIASTLGSNPDSSVAGASGGKLDWSSTAITCSPAPIANRSSVAVGESDTIRSGRSSIVTSPLVPSTVTGNYDGSEDGDVTLPPGTSSDPTKEPHAATDSPSRSATMKLRRLPISPPSDPKELRWASFSSPTNRPSFEDRRLRDGGGDPTRPPKGLHGCGTVPDSNRSSLHPVAPGLPCPGTCVVPPRSDGSQRNPVVRSGFLQ